MTEHIDFAARDMQAVDEYRQQNNTSVLVVMFTDMKGSTELAEREGEQAYNALRTRHNQMLISIIERGAAGRYIKSIGDAIMAVFAKPSEAIERALEIQRVLASYNHSCNEGEEIVVRIGMHMGQVAVEDSSSLDVFGRHVNRAARVESITPVGHILLTQSVYDSAKGWLTSKKIEFTDHGSFLLKGITEAVEIWEVTERGVASPAAPAFLSIRDRLARMPVANAVIALFTLVFLSVLYIIIVPTIEDALKRYPTVLDQAEFYGNVYKSSLMFSEFWWVAFVLLAGVDAFLQYRYVGALRIYWQARVLYGFNVVLAIYAAVVYMSATVILTLFTYQS